MSGKVLRYDAKRDIAEPKIVEFLEGVGASVIRLDDFDLLVGYRGKNILIEVKTGNRKLNERQIKLHEEWKGQIDVARSEEDVQDILDLYTLDD